MEGIIMRKELGRKPLIYPQPVLIIGTYDENGTPDLMNAAWGAVGDDHQVFLCLSPEHKTVKNILAKKEFTVSIGTEDQLAACDYIGIVSANDTPDKVERSGFHTSRAAHVDAPTVDELPLALECRLVSYEDEHCHLFGDIVCSSADESILTNGKVDAAKLKPIIYDFDTHDYWSFGSKVGKAFKDGLKLKK